MAKQDYGWRLSPLLAVVAGSAGGWFLQKKPFKKNFEAHQRHKHKKQTDKTQSEKCPCQAFRLCDSQWNELPSGIQEDWDNALKKHRMSGYTLWMKECLCTMNMFGT